MYPSTRFICRGLWPPRNSGSGRSYLHEEGRVSLRALKREFEIDDGTLDELVEELVEIQSVAVLDRG